MKRKATSSGTPWDEMTNRRALGIIGAIAVLGLYRSRSVEGWVPILDFANLVFHEAGHPIYGLLGSTMKLYGGTIGQLTFPILCAATFWYRRNSAGFALCVAWFFENFFGIAQYIADARSQELPLVGGGEHDWYAILERWGALDRDLEIAHRVRLLGSFGLWMVASWTGWRWWRSRLEAAAAPAPSGPRGPVSHADRHGLR
jgi:hypothetical protein